MAGKSMRKILVTGASGQIGSEMAPHLRERYGKENVVCTDIRKPVGGSDQGPFETLDVTDKKGVEDIVAKYNIDTIFHLAAILSVVGEQKPLIAWKVNMNGLHNILEVAREQELFKVFCPSSIAVFGPETPKTMTPQETVMRPRTIYGITKAAGELLCNYYFNKYGLDVRGVRWPGIISNVAPPGGGTTDYAVEIFYEAIRHGKYVCFVGEDTVLPMMYMPDCLKSALDLMEADLSRLKHHSDFNIASMSFSAGELSDEIKKHIPDFRVEYSPDFRQKIADSWPRSMDDSAAKEEWGWKPRYDLSSMTRDMVEKLGKRHREGRL